MVVNLHVGVDWSRTKQDWLCINDQGAELARGIAEHTAAGLSELVSKFAALADGDLSRLRVVIERTDGALVAFLLESGIEVGVLSPARSAVMRKLQFLEGKDDVRDARSLAEASRTHSKLCQPLVLRPEAEVLRVILRLRKQRVDSMVATNLRLQELFADHFPALMRGAAGRDFWTRDWFAETFAAWSCDPANPKAVADVMVRTRGKKKDANKVFEALKGGLDVSEHVRFEIGEQLVEYHRLHDQVERYTRRLSAILQALSAQEQVAVSVPTLHADDERHAEAEQGVATTEMTETVFPQPGQRLMVSLLQTLPGLGPILVSKLLVFAGHLLVTHDAQALKVYSGVAPARYQSGKGPGRAVMRQSCNAELRVLMHQWADKAIIFDPATRQRYDALRNTKKQSHAYRIIANGLIDILMSMLKHQRSYDPMLRGRKQGAAAA